MDQGSAVLDSGNLRAHGPILGELINDLDIRGNLVTDAQLAALAIEHGVSVVSLDSDFARFPHVRWVKPGEVGAASP